MNNRGIIKIIISEHSIFLIHSYSIVLLWSIHYSFGIAYINTLLLFLGRMCLSIYHNFNLFKWVQFNEQKNKLGVSVELHMLVCLLFLVCFVPICCSYYFPERSPISSWGFKMALISCILTSLPYSTLTSDIYKNGCCLYLLLTKCCSTFLSKFLLSDHCLISFSKPSLLSFILLFTQSNVSVLSAIFWLYFPLLMTQ